VPLFLSTKSYSLSALFLVFINVYASVTHAVDFINAGPPFINIKKMADENLANVSATLQDSQGFTWFVNSSGLLRFDGNEFKLFPGLEQFTSPNVDHIVEGQLGRLWIATLDKGLALFDTKSEELTFFDLTKTFNIDKKADGQPLPVNMLLYKNKHLYLASKDNVLKINEQDLTVEKRYRFPIADNASIVRLLVTAKGDIWSSSNPGNGVIRLNEKGFTHFKHQPSISDTISSSFVASIYEDSQKRLWFGGIAGVDLFLPESDRFLHFSPFDLSSLAHKNKGALANFVLNISEDKEQALWLGMLNSGVIKFLPSQKTFEHYPHINDVSSTILTDNIFDDVLFDKQQTFWVPTTKGLSKLSRDNREITQWVNIDKENCKATGIHETKQGLLFACNKALYRLHQNQITRIANFDEKIRSIYQTSNNNIWLGTLGAGIYRYNLAEGTTNHYGFTSDVHDHLGVNLVHSLRTDINNDLYGIAGKHTTTKGSALLRYNADQDKFSSIATGLELGNWLDINKNKLVLIDSLSNQAERLYWFDKTKQTIDKMPITTGKVFAIIKWQQQLWVSTQALGLITINIETGRWQKLTDKSNDLISGFYLDGSAKNLYFSSKNQLYKLNSVTEDNIASSCMTCSLVLDSPTMNDLQVGQLFKGYSFLTTTGHFFISSENKLLSFSIKAVEASDVKSQLLLTDYKVLGKSVSPDKHNEHALLNKSIAQTQHITIPPETTFFSLSFSKVGADQPKQIKYAYKMEGLNQDWVYAKKNHAQADYSLLPSGSYTFKVKASNNDGLWQDQVAPLSLTITVLTPWWKTWWAYSFYLLNIFSLFWLFYRTKLAEKERQTSLELVNAKEQLFANISHEFRTPLTLVLGPAKAIKTNNNDQATQQNASLIERNALRLLSMVDQLLQLAQLKNPQKTSNDTQNVSSICQFVLQAFEAVSIEKQISLKLEGSIDDTWCVSAGQNALETILSNLLTNAIKFTPVGGNISLDVTAQGQWLAFTVTDDGSGIAEHEQSKIFNRFTRLENSNYIPGAGIGLALVKELVGSLGGKISVRSQLNEGSSFKFTLPQADASTLDTLSKLQCADGIQQLLLTEQLNSACHPKKDTSDNNENDLSLTYDEPNENSNNVYKPSLLIVDDNQEMRAFIKLSLADNYLTIEAENGQQALAQALKYSPDIIISDIMMPIMDGFELLTSIRNDAAVSHIPFILLTAKGDQQSKLKGLSDLADDYMTKPFDGDELMVRVQRLLGVRTLLQKRFNPLGITEGENDTADNTSKNSETTMKPHVLSGAEQRFLQRFKELIQQEYTNSALTLSMISSQLAMSDRQLQRKLKALSGTSFNEMLREYRLTQGQQLLNNGEQIAIIADQIGFTSSSYFVRCFKAKYGKPPNGYRKVS